MLRWVARSVFVFAIAGLALLAIPAPRSQAATPLISLGMPATVQVGQTFTASLQLTGGSEVAAFEARVEFDFNFVSYVPDSAQLGPFLGSTGRTPFCVTPIVTETYVHIGCGTRGPEPPAPSGDGVLATLQFTATRPGVTRFYVPAPPCELATVLGINILPITCAPATLTVIAATPTPIATSTATPPNTPTFTPTPVLSATQTALAGATQTALAGATQTVLAGATHTPTAEGSATPAVSATPVATGTTVNETLGGVRPRGPRPSALPNTGSSRGEATGAALLFEFSLLACAAVASLGGIVARRR